MSLKNVHVLFIAVAVSMVLYCAVLAFGSFRADGSPLMAALSAALAGAAALMVRYETLFVRRCRREGIR